MSRARPASHLLFCIMVACAAPLTVAEATDAGAGSEDAIVRAEAGGSSDADTVDVVFERGDATATIDASPNNPDVGAD